MHPDYKPISFFAGLFSEKWVHFEPLEFASWLKGMLGDFDQEPQLIPTPSNAPGEAPRLAMFGDNRSKILELAPRKINLRWIPKGAAAGFGEQYDQFVRLLSNVAYKVTEHEYAFNRVGVIVTLFREFRQDGRPLSVNQKLADYFMQRRDVFDPAPSEIHLNLHSQFDLSSRFPINRWIRLRTLRRSPDNEDCALQAEIDLNTLPVMNRHLSLQDIHDFFAQVRAHLEREIDFLHNPEF